MKIVHVVEPLATGINTFILQLTRNISDAEHIVLHGIRKEGQNIDEIKAEYPKNTRFIHWENAQREIAFTKDFKAYRELRNKLKELQPDIIHLHSSKAGILGRLAAHAVGNKKVVYTPNAASFLRTDISNFKRKVFEKIEQKAAKYPGKIISSSTCEENAYKKLKIPTQLIYNGAQIIPKNTKKKNVFTVVNCGVVSIQKNPSLFNEIASHYKEDHGIRFIWIGNGDSENSLNSPNIEVSGWKSKNDVFELLHSADLYLSSSLWEGLPLAGIEAMGSGLPLLLNDCPGNNNLVFPEENGFLFKSKEEAILLLDRIKKDEKFRSNLSKGSNQIYQDNFTDTACSAAYKELYKSL